MRQIKIDVINHATNLPDLEAAAVVRALQKQLDRDFQPAWGVSALVHFVPTGSLGDPKHWWLVLLDNADQGAVLGYHDLTDTGLPLGKVFVETTKLYKGQWSVTASHELLEMMADPWINYLVFMEAGFARTGNAHLVGLEVCDPCEADSQGYLVDSVLVSDFVFPTYFEADRSAGPYDYRGLITTPFQILPQGYLGVLPVGVSGGWTQINGAAAVTADTVTGKRTVSRLETGVVIEEGKALPETPSVFRSRPHDGSRRQKRQLAWAGSEWILSRALSMEKK